VIPDADGVLLHDPHTGSTHRLNGLAQQIWELCDGTRDRAGIAEAIAVRFGIAAADAAPDIDSTLSQFRHVGLIRTTGISQRECTVLTHAVGAALGVPTELPADTVAGVDWNAVVHLAVDHGVMPLLHRCVSTVWHNEVPAIVRDRLQHQYDANAIVIEGYLAELCELVTEMAVQDVAALPLRGPAMAQSLYGSAAMRQFGDLDIFVAPDRSERARDILKQRGYEFRASRPTDVLAMRTSTVGEIWVDLQWSIARHVFRFPVTLERLWGRLTTIDIRGVGILQPVPEDYLLILAAHASKHCWSALIWLADIVALLRVHGETIHWTRLLDRAAKAGGERQLLLALRLARDVLRADLPDAVVRRFDAHPALDSLVADVERSLFVSVQQRSFQGSFGVIRGGLFYARTRERMRDRVPHLVYLLKESFTLLVDLTRPNHLDRAVIKLPASLGFLYYGVRVVRVTLSRLSAIGGRAPKETS